MIIPILIFCILAVGIIGCIINRNNYEYWHVPITILGMAFALISSGVLIKASCNNISFRADYLVQQMYIESVSTNNTLTSAERISIIEKTNDINAYILTNRKMYNDIWVGWYFADEPAKYELLDISKITNANQKITISGDSL